MEKPVIGDLVYNQYLDGGNRLGLIVEIFNKTDN